MTGLREEFILCTSSRPLMVGADGFRFTYFHFSSLMDSLYTVIDRVPYLFLENTGEFIV